ncbi:unnamed protein product [marine sediment metagenome]|uniref:Periplasmic heavy metal sensor n=1 Tax=marine sediment metagenome TaxID=412755 RepID=X0T5D0_9ZZZZ
MNKKKLTSIVVIIIVYLLGLVTGSLATKAGIRYCFRGRKGHGRIARKIEGRMVNRLSSKLQLTDEQKTEIESIIETHRPEMKKLRESIGEKMKTLKNTMHQDIKKVLTDEQQSGKFEEIIKKHGRFHKRNGPGERNRKSPPHPEPE